jgi:hypothetical protein
MTQDFQDRFFGWFTSLPLWQRVGLYAGTTAAVAVAGYLSIGAIFS